MSHSKHLYLVANWKSNKTWEDAKHHIEDLSLPESKHLSIIICPPMPYVMPVAGLIQERNIPAAVGAQDVSSFSFGAYTGAVSAMMLSEIVSYVIVGHSERRRYFHETNQEVADKARLAIDAGITPIVCIDEPYLTTQLSFFTSEEMKKIIVAYEPLSAIGSGNPDTPDHAELVAAKICQVAQIDIPVLYGGSVKPETTKQFVNQPHITGVLVGGASLEASSWNALVQAVA